MRAHKITLQSLWRMLMPLLLRSCERSNLDLAWQISHLLSSAQVNELITILKSPELQTVFDAFVAQKSQENVNFRFWWSYIEMVSTLLDFTRAQRRGQLGFVFG